MPECSSLFNLAEKYGQGHVFQFWDELSADERSELLRSMEDFKFENLKRLFEISDKKTSTLEHRLKPPDQKICGSLAQLRLENHSTTLEKFKKSALQAIHSGKVAVLLLAGGQGTRLGFHLPKGLFSPGLPSGRSLCQIQAEQILRAQQLAKEEFGAAPPIPWYIMTSEHTEEATIAFFKSHDYFGHQPENIIFFEQFTLPAFDFDGKILMDKKYKLSVAPDGNGGLYRALRERGILADMASRGVEYIQIYCVDNILVKVPDLCFVGFCIERSADCAAQVVQKVEPTEPIGVVAMIDGSYRVVEYSEISPDVASLRCAPEETPNPGETHPVPPRLVYSHGNICVHHVTRSFLESVCQPDRLELLGFHRAKKKIPYIDLTTGQRVTPAEPNGIKFEQFVFDVFPFAERFALWEVPRKERFSPLKNGDGASTDCPRTSRIDYLTLHTKLALAAGARLAGPSPSSNADTEVRCANGTQFGAMIEISPLVSYDGENLDCLNGVELRGLNLLELDKDTREPRLIQLRDDRRPQSTKH